MQIQGGRQQQPIGSSHTNDGMVGAKINKEGTPEMSQQATSVPARINNGNSNSTLNIC